MSDAAGYFGDDGDGDVCRPDDEVGLDVWREGIETLR